MATFDTSSSFRAALDSLSRTSNRIANLFQNFSTGQAVNSGRDSPVLLSRIGELTASINGFGVANNNIANANGVLNTANGGLMQTLTNLQSLRENAVQAADETLSSQDRATLQTQSSALLDSVDQLANGVNFNGENLLNGSFGSRSIQVGPNSGDSVQIATADVRTSALNIDDIDLSNATTAGEAITAIDSAINEVTSALGNIGADMNRVESIARTNDSIVENLTAARSVSEDLDFGKGISLLVQEQIKQKAGILVLKKTIDAEKTNLSFLI